MRRWRRAGVAAAAGAILLALPSISGAMRSQELPLIAGQGVTVAGSKIQCSVGKDVGYGLNLKGKTYIFCGPSTNVKGGGYIALMDSDGRVYVLSIKTHKTVSFRTPAAAVRSAGTWKARLHDQVIVAGEPMICGVITLDSEPTLLCSFFSRKDLAHPRANSFAFAINDTHVLSVEWDAQRQSHILGDWPER
jgi:hypothetical protein